MRIEATIGFITEVFEMTDRKLERVQRFVRTRQRQPDLVRKAGPMRSRRAYSRAADEAETREAIEDWADDMNGLSVWED